MIAGDFGLSPSPRAVSTQQRQPQCSRSSHLPASWSYATRESRAENAGLRREPIQFKFQFIELSTNKITESLKGSGSCKAI